MVIAALGLAAVVIVTLVMEAEGKYVHEDLDGAGTPRALILYHPSRDAHFSDDLTLALAEGLRTAGFRVERAILTRETPARPEGFGLIAVVCNTYWWTPDLPTLRYLKRARLDSVPVVGLIGGAGSTTRAERLLDQALHGTGATVIGTRSFWLLRPNDETRMKEPNRKVARDLARDFGLQSGKRVLAGEVKAWRGSISRQPIRQSVNHQYY